MVQLHLEWGFPVHIQVLLVLAFTVGWYCIGKFSRFFSERLFVSYRKLSPIAKRDWDIRVASNAHGYFQIILACTLVPAYWNEIFSDPYAFNSRAINVFLAGATGYFIQDLIMMLIYYGTPIFSWSAVCHHVMSIIANGTALLTGYCGVLILSVGIQEWSTPFVNQRWFYDACHMKSGLGYAINGILLWFVFTCVRVPFTYFLYRVIWPTIDDCLTQPTYIISALFGTMSTSILLNLWWSWAVTKGLAKHVLGVGKKPKKDQ
ncbi:putative transmembrane protein 56 [Paratrimastix pyriformis]|uniref:Transmembrane protein 56 n=1 Tax=Paratrimastix pyriformis TaxID=342808 RepID=A0ABQ8UP87_9EUKA|nr:putative transmembrane protein 56 [Paratrimastix pyriformis]